MSKEAISTLMATVYWQGLDQELPWQFADMLHFRLAARKTFQGTRGGTDSYLLIATYNR